MSIEKYKIEHNIQITGQNSRGSKLYPFAEMDVGDSFTFPEEEISKIRSAAFWYGKRNNKKFSTRTNRIWRIK